MPERRRGSSHPTAGTAAVPTAGTAAVPTPDDLMERPAGSLDVDGGRLSIVPGERPPSVPADGAAGDPAGGTVVLLHGAGSGTEVPVLAGLAARLAAAGLDVARLEMPYRVAGRRAPDRPARLDGVLRAAAAALRELGRPQPLALAGRSTGSRVACRCARDVAAAGVLALGFPLTPPGGRPGRAAELTGAGVPVLVIQGDRDPFGMPSPDRPRDVDVHVLAGADHSFRTRASDPRRTAEVEAEAIAVGAAWLVRRLAAQARGPADPAARQTGQGRREGR
jgi:predicted alpha/beta-hydrolase family hydrolase